MSEDENKDSFLKALLRGFARSLFDSVSAGVKESAGRAIDWTMRRVIGYLIAAAVVIASTVFLLVAAAEGLKAASLPPYVAHLIMGAASLGGGLLLLQLMKPKDHG